MSNAVIKPVQPKPEVQFKAEPVGSNGDTYGIRIYIDGRPTSWVHWIECGGPKMHVVRSPGIVGPDGVTPCGWAGAKSQAEMAAEELQRFYDEGSLV